MQAAVAANPLHGSLDRLAEEADRGLATSTFQAPLPLPTTPEVLSDAVGQAA